MARIFISHSSKDRPQAERLLDWLQSQGLVTAFLDFDEAKGIPPGADWERTLYDEIRACDAVIAILTRNSFNSKWCFVEYSQARALGKTIIPIIETPEGETYVSEAIQHLSMVKDREGGLERLRDQLTKIAVSGTGGFLWDNKRPPYPGMLAFQEEDAAIYFGRGDDIVRLFERLNANRAHSAQQLLVVLGPSGSGKSSLLRAGLLPRLKLFQHEWIVLPPFRPELRPIDQLAEVIAGATGKTDWREWRAALEKDDIHGVLSDLARDLRVAHRQNEAYIVVSVDQGEELFGNSGRQQAEQFFAVLNAMLDQHLPYLVIMTLRSDYLDRLQMEQHLAAEFEQFSLKPMPVERWRLLIEEPARVAGIKIDPELAKAAMADAGTDDALPLLAFALRELYERSKSTGAMTLEAYRALGDPQAQLSPLENAVRRKADEVLHAAKPSEEDLQALEEAFIPAMVRVNTEGEYVRRPAPMNELPKRALPLIERLAKAYLLTVRKEPGGTVVEVAHEAMLRKWPRLRGWLDAQREFLIGKEQLEQDLRDWERAEGEQKTETLLWGLKLARAQSWLGTKARQLTGAEKRFIAASIKHTAQRRRARILRVVGTLVGGICLVFTIAIVYQWKERQAAQAAEASALGFSAAEMERNQPVSLAFLAKAMREDPGNESAIALAIAELRDAELPLYTMRPNPMPKDEAMEDGEFSPDGSRVVTASSDGAARLWDTKSGRQLPQVLVHSNLVRTAEFDPTGELIVTASYDGTVGVWDAHTGDKLYSLPEKGGFNALVLAAHFDKWSRTIVASYSDGYVRLWDVKSRQQVGNGFQSGDSVWDAVFDPIVFRRVVSASQDKRTGVQVWDAASGKAVALRQGNGVEDAGPISAVAFSSDGRWIAAGNDTGKAWVWNAQSLKPACSGRPLQHSDGINSISFNPQPGKDAQAAPVLVTASRDGTARLWSLPSCQQVGQPMRHSGWVRSAFFSVDGRWILTASYDHSARVWDLSGNPVTPPMRHSGAIYMAHFDPADPHLVVTASFDGSARVWRWYEHKTSPPISGKGTLAAVCWNRDASRILTVTDGGAQTWDAHTSQPIAGLSFPAIAGSAAACSPDGRRIVTVSGRTAQIWDAGNGRPAAAPISLPAAPVDAIIGAGVVYDPQNRWFAVVAPGNVWLWDAKTAQPLIPGGIHPQGNLNGATFSADGIRIATYTKEGNVQVWSLPDGKPVETGQPMKHNSNVVSAAFNRDGTLLVTASADRTVRVWEVATGKELGRLSFDHWATDAAFSPDGRWIATASANFTTQIWDAHSYKPSGPLLRQSAEIKHVEFSSDGRWVLTYSADGVAQAWGAQTGIPVTEPLRGPQPDPLHLSGACFSKDQNWIAGYENQAADASNVRRWQIEIEEAPLTGLVAPDWLVSMAEGVGGLTVDAHGGIEQAPGTEDPDALREKLSKLPGADPVSRFGRWLASDPDTRPISPRAEQ